MGIPNDEELLKKARNAKNGIKFRALYDNGDTSSYGDDKSKADLALCVLLAYWTKGDTVSIERLFRGSKLYRKEWDRENYLTRIINKAIKYYNKSQESSNTNHKSSDDAKLKIYTIRDSIGGKGGCKKFDGYHMVAEVVDDDLKLKGKYYYDAQKRAYLFLRKEKKLFEIDKNNVEFELIMYRYGIFSNEEVYIHVINELRMAALSNGEYTEIHIALLYNTSRNILYIYNNDHHIYKISTKRIELVENGCDGVLFLYSSKRKPFKVNAHTPDQSYFDKLILQSINLESDRADEIRIVFIVWFYSLFFPQLFPTKAIAAMIGEKGSGKSYTFKAVGRLLFGSSFDVMQLTNDPKDFDAAVSNSPFVAIDNADVKVPWLEDRLAVAATGGSVDKRKLYTDNTMVQFPIIAFLGITSRTPYFRRDDVADRLLIFRLKRLEGFTPESFLLEQLDSHRNELWTEVMFHLQEILEALSSQPRQKNIKFRMADFADFALRIAANFGYREEMLLILQKASEEQTSFMLEGDVIVDLLDKWLTMPKNEERRITAVELCNELSDLAMRDRVEFYFRGKTRAFAQQIKKLVGPLRQYFEIIEHESRGRCYVAVPQTVIPTPRCIQHVTNPTSITVLSYPYRGWCLKKAQGS